MTEDRWREAAAASARALAALDDETDVERALAQAVATRYAWPSPSEQRPFDEAYAKAMEEVFERFPDDPEVGTLYAESLMNLQPWDYWNEHRTPKGRTVDFVAAIEHVLANHPDHPGASHLYIHAMEAGPTPEKAVPYADRLLTRVPGAGHLVHMPSHIYARVGRYGDAADSNAMAVAVDQAYFEVAPPPTIYMVYYAHNQHFLAFASMMEGRFEPAMKAARECFATCRRRRSASSRVSSRHHADGLPRARALREVARGARADAAARLPTRLARRPLLRPWDRALRLGRTIEAREDIEKFEEAASEIPGEWYVFNNKVSDVLPIARAMLEGELAYREGRLDDAWAALRRGIEHEDRLIYDEPPAWMFPVRHAMGALLMAAGKPAEAEQLYREDQKRHPGNTWSLLGLRDALAAQDRAKEAADVGTQLEEAWKRVIVKPTSSCFCEPGPRRSGQTRG